MSCELAILKQVPLFALLDDDELAVLAAQVELRTFAPRQRIYKLGDSAGTAYVLMSGAVRVTTIDEDQQDVVFDEPASGEFFGFASLLDETPHQTTAIALEQSVCLEVHRHDLLTLVERKPHAAVDMMTVLGRRLHAAQTLIRSRATRNPNAVIEAEATLGERLADGVAGFGGSWTFIIVTMALLGVYCLINARAAPRLIKLMVHRGRRRNVPPVRANPQWNALKAGGGRARWCQPRSVTDDHLARASRWGMRSRWGLGGHSATLELLTS